MRIFVFPMYSNTRNLAGDSGLTIPISIIRAIPDWHFYVAFPETWSQQERGLFLFKDLPNLLGEDRRPLNDLWTPVLDEGLQKVCEPAQNR